MCKLFNCFIKCAIWPFVETVAFRIIDYEPVKVAPIVIQVFYKTGKFIKVFKKDPGLIKNMGIRLLSYLTSNERVLTRSFTQSSSAVQPPKNSSNGEFLDLRLLRQWSRISRICHSPAFLLLFRTSFHGYSKQLYSQIILKVLLCMTLFNNWGKNMIIFN